jgi:hypothetical protein
MAPDAPPVAGQPSIEGLVERLASPNYFTREAADAEIKRRSEFGPSIIDILNRMRDATDDPEVKARLGAIIADSSEEEVKDLFTHQLEIPHWAPEHLQEEADADLQEARDDLEAARFDTSGGNVEERRKRRQARAERVQKRIDAISEYEQRFRGPPK